MPFIERWQTAIDTELEHDLIFLSSLFGLSPPCPSLLFPLFPSGHHRATKISHSNQSRTSDGFSFPLFLLSLFLPSPAAKTLIKRSSLRLRRARWPPRMRWIWTAQKAAAAARTTTITTVKIAIYRSTVSHLSRFEENKTLLSYKLHFPRFRPKFKIIENGESNMIWSLLLITKQKDEENV